MLSCQKCHREIAYIGARCTSGECAGEPGGGVELNWEKIIAQSEGVVREVAWAGRETGARKDA